MRSGSGLFVWGNTLILLTEHHEFKHNYSNCQVHSNHIQVFIFVCCSSELMLSRALQVCDL